MLISLGYNNSDDRCLDLDFTSVESDRPQSIF